uniref:Uncharacterized protein n=1 Tax=Romanomermis culicivorax TaxID=13658 RepID=A0A915HJ64_ROMCU
MNINYSERMRSTLLVLACILVFILCSLLPINAYTELIEAKLISGNSNFAFQDNDSFYNNEIMISLTVFHSKLDS